MLQVILEKEKKDDGLSSIIDKQYGLTGATPLHSAVRNEELELIRLLVQYGANITGNDRLGRTPLELARNCRFSGKRDEIIQMLQTYEEDEIVKILETYLNINP